MTDVQSATYDWWRNVCAICGLIDPAGFMVPDRVWKHYVHEDHRHNLICFGCWTELVQHADGGRYMNKHGAGEGTFWIFGSPKDMARIGPRPPDDVRRPAHVTTALQEELNL
jgi:hypothetical protein